MHHVLIAATCPSGVAAVVGAVCNAASGVSGAAGGIASAGIGGIFDAATQWVASGAVWLLDQVGHLMSVTTDAGLSTSWFSASSTQMAVIAGAVVLPMACVGAIQAIYRQSPATLTRLFLVNLPLSLLLTGVAVEMVRLGLAFTDAISQQVLSAGGVDTANFLSPVSSFLSTAGAADPSVPAFVVFVAAIVVAVCAMAIWIELVVRAAAIAAATLFLPLALATLVWPAISHWCRRLAETIAALVLSKFVIAAVLSLAAGAVAGGLGSDTSSGGGFSAVVVGVALLLLASFAPFTLLRLIPLAEAGAIAHLESLRHRVARGGQQVVSGARQVAALASGPEGFAVASALGGGSEDVSSSMSPATMAGGPGGRSMSTSIDQREGHGRLTGDAAKAFGLAQEDLYASSETSSGEPTGRGSLGGLDETVPNNGPVSEAEGERPANMLFLERLGEGDEGDGREPGEGTEHRAAWNDSRDRPT